MLSFFPCAQICEVSPEQALDCVLYVMYRWGHIRCFRFDNGRPFGDPQRQRRTACVLQLIARGCQVIINPPRSPVKNAKVERCQGTTGKWSDYKNCENLEEFRQTLDYAIIAQRERLPSRVCGGKTRIEYFPELLTNPRKYKPKDFDINRIYKYLSTGKWYRKISKTGQMNIFGKRYQVGLKHRRKDVIIKFKTIKNKPYWIVYDDQQIIINRLLAENIEDSSYFNLKNSPTRASEK